MKREKPTSDKVLPPVAEFVAEKEHAVFRYIDLDGNEQALDYRELTAHDPAVLPMPVDREGYSSVEHSDRYWATGHGDLQNVKAAWQKYADQPPKKIFDFGCSSGRFLRHVHYFTDVQPHGCDFAPANVNWAHKYLPSEVKIVLNSAEPTLPYDDATFCCVTAFSVFTHIDQQEKQWLRELTRITRPGGLLYLTIQNQSAWDRVIERPGMLDHLSRANHIDGNLTVDENLFKQPMPKDRIVFKMSNDDIYNCNVWMTNQYIRSAWAADLKLIGIFENAHSSFQSVVVLQR